MLSGGGVNSDFIPVKLEIRCKPNPIIGGARWSRCLCASLVVGIYISQAHHYQRPWVYLGTGVLQFQPLIHEKMIMEKAEELLALTKAQRLLLYSTRDGNIDLPILALWGSLILGLLLTIDYGYMIYLHYRMVSTYLILSYPEHTVV